MATTQEVELLRRQLEELNARMEEIRQQSANAAMNAAVTGLIDAVTTMGHSVTRPRLGDMRVGKPEWYMPGKDFDDWGFTFNGYAGALDPAYPALLKAARQSTTVGLQGSSRNHCPIREAWRCTEIACLTLRTET